MSGFYFSHSRDLKIRGSNDEDVLLDAFVFRATLVDRCIDVT